MPNSLLSPQPTNSSDLLVLSHSHLSGSNSSQALNNLTTPVLIHWMSNTSLLPQLQALSPDCSLIHKSNSHSLVRITLSPHWQRLNYSLLLPLEINRSLQTLLSLTHSPAILDSLLPLTTPVSLIHSL